MLLAGIDQITPVTNVRRSRSGYGRRCARLWLPFIHKTVSRGLHVQYQVRFVSDHSLPDGVTWAFARQAGRTFLFVKQSAINATTGRCDALTHAWEAWQEVEARATLHSLRRFAATG